MHRLTGAGDGAPKRYPAKFRRKVLDLFASGRPEAEAQVAYDLQICAQLSYPWRPAADRQRPDPCRRPVERHTSQRQKRTFAETARSAPWVYAIVPERKYFLLRRRRAGGYVPCDVSGRRGSAALIGRACGNAPRDCPRILCRNVGCCSLLLHGDAGSTGGPASAVFEASCQVHGLSFRHFQQLAACSQAISRKTHSRQGDSKIANGSHVVTVSNRTGHADGCAAAAAAP